MAGGGLSSRQPLANEPRTAPHLAPVSYDKALNLPGPDVYPENAELDVSEDWLKLIACRSEPFAKPWAHRAPYRFVASMLHRVLRAMLLQGPVW